MTDPFVGTLAFARVYSGVLKVEVLLKILLKKKRKNRQNASNAC